jgi:hypothetical protein
LTAPLDLAALRSLVERATPGPWEIDDERSRYGEKYPNGDPIDDNDIHGIHGPGGVAIVKTDCGVYPPDRPDAEFIAASRTAVPALLDMVEALKAEVERLRKLFDDAGQGEHNVLALVEFYQGQELAAEAERDALRARVERLEAAALAAHRTLQHYSPDFESPYYVAMVNLEAALAPSPGEPSQLDGRAVQGVQKEKP